MLKRRTKTVDDHKFFTGNSKMIQVEGFHEHHKNNCHDR